MYGKSNDNFEIFCRMNSEGVYFGRFIRKMGIYGKIITWSVKVKGRAVPKKVKF